MCGIAGFFSKRPATRSVADEMLSELKRRGPDASGKVLWNDRMQRTDDHAWNALISTRLAIMDPSPLANQPMCNESGDIWMVYNGEVYDWAAAAKALASGGAQFRTHCDTEFVLKAYEKWGIGCIERLRGMFAIAILDMREQVLWLIRDRIGLKPLVYSCIDGNLAFGSTVRSVLPFLEREQRRVSHLAIDAYLAHRYVPAPRTIMENVNRLENGHWLRFDLRTRELEKSRYWFPKPSPGALLHELDEAISIRTVSDRSVGLFLSSGVDSSTLGSRLAAMGRNEIETLTASFPGSAMDESADARDIAEQLGFGNSAIPVPEKIDGEFARIIADLDEPFADPSSIPTWYLCQEATRRFKVVLGGEGLDELLGGYKRVWKHLRTRWRRSVSAPWLPALAKASPKGWTKWSSELEMTWLEAYSLRFSGFSPSQRRFFQPDLRESPKTHWRMPQTECRSPIDALLEIDMDNYLPEYVLRKADLCSMAHGLELRAPYLDHHWVQAISAVPESERFTHPPKKLLESICPGLGSLRLFERKKRGFNPPLDRFLSNCLAPRFDGLGKRLESFSLGQIDRSAVEAYCGRYIGARDQPSEQLLQLLILDQSLSQLTAAAS